MKSVRLELGINLDGESLQALAVLLEQTIEKGMRRFRDSLPREVEERPARKETMAPSPPVAPPVKVAVAPSKDEALLLDTRAVCKLLAVSPRTVWSMQVSGKMPAPTRIGRCVRWSYDAIKEWVDAGCPAERQSGSPPL